MAWTFINQHFELNHLIAGSTENNDRNGYLGLVSEHAYSILDAQEVHIATKKGKKKERILKMSNPWGKYEWKGKLVVTQEGGLTTQTSGVRNSGSSSTSRKQMMAFFGSTLKILYRTSGKSVFANIIKITSAPPYQ